MEDRWPGARHPAGGQHRVLEDTLLGEGWRRGRGWARSTPSQPSAFLVASEGVVVGVAAKGPHDGLGPP